MKINNVVLLCSIVFPFLASCNKESPRWYDYEDWWNYCSNGINGVQATKKDVGKEVDLTVNGQIHKVRLIDVDRDILSNGAGKAHTTWEFANLLCDSDGYSLATLWDDSNSGRPHPAYNYTHSTIRRNLIGGEGNGAPGWYQIRQSKKTTKEEYNGKTVLDMLPSGLVLNIKPVKRIITGYNRDIEINDKLFLLSVNETNAQTKQAQPHNAYEYYKDAEQLPAPLGEPKRVKTQIKGMNGALTDRLGYSIEDTNYGGGGYSFAGFHKSPKVVGLSPIYWTQSAYIDGDWGNTAWNISSDGSFSQNPVYYGALPIAPAFCV